MSRKTFDGVELLRRLRDKEVRDRQRFLLESTIILGRTIEVEVRKNSSSFYLMNLDLDEELNVSWLLNSKVEDLDKEDNENIEEMDTVGIYNTESIIENRLKINEIIRKVNKINNRKKRVYGKARS